MIFLKNISWNDEDRYVKEDRVECEVDYGSEAVLKAVLKNWLERKYGGKVKSFDWTF